MTTHVAAYRGSAQPGSDGALPHAADTDGLPAASDARRVSLLAAGGAGGRQPNQ